MVQFAQLRKKFLLNICKGKYTLPGSTIKDVIAYRVNC